MVALAQAAAPWPVWRRDWPSAFLWIGLAAVAAPTLIRNAQQSWTLEQGQQAPLVLALGLWQLWRRWPLMRQAGGAGGLAGIVLMGVPAAALYILGRLAQQYTLETYGLYGLGVATVYGLVGALGLRSGWFALLYLLFALPLPYTVVWFLTVHLRLWVTEVSVALAQLAGLSIVRDGLNILVDQYELAVQEACSGMNSLFSLSAVGLLYLQLKRDPPWWYVLLMAVPIVAFALLGNLVRILVLIALTHFFGDRVAQSFLHETAGLVTFATALAGVAALDAALAGFLLGQKGEVA